MDTSLESEIISTAHHLDSLITMYMLATNPPVDAYYSDLCGRLERFASIIERSKQNTRKREIDCASGVIIIKIIIIQIFMTNLKILLTE